MKRKPYFSIIIPVYNEEGNLSFLLKKVEEVMKGLKKNWELIFVNDGSTDKSEQALVKLRRKKPRVKVINFARNFGQTAALSAGFNHAQGQILITLDGDLQNDPKDIPRLLKVLKEERADVVAGWRKKRLDPFPRGLISTIANRIINQLIGSQFHDLGCTLRVYKKKAVSELILYGEMHRFIPILAMAEGSKVVEVGVAHYPRRHGQSKYGFWRAFKVLLDLITLKFLVGFQTKPIYMFGSAGMIFILLSWLSGVFVIARKIFWGGEWVSPMLFVAITLFNAGVMCTLMGLLAEIQVRTWFESTQKKSYLIKDILG